MSFQAPIEPEMSPCFDIIRTTYFWSRITRFNALPERKRRPASRLTAILHKCIFFCLSANLAESNAGNNQNLTEFKTDSLGRMDDSEASNEGFYVHKFIKRYQFLSLSLPSR